MPLIKSSNFNSRATAFSMKDIERQAGAMIDRAREQAEQIIVNARKQAVELKRQAVEHGFLDGQAKGTREGKAQGLKAGHAQALNETKAHLTQLMQSLTEAMREIDAQRSNLESEATAEVVELAMAIARRVTKRQAQSDNSVLSANLCAAMKLVVSTADLRIAIHPSQKQTLLTELPNLQLDWPVLAHVELVDDPSLSPGGCRIYTRQGMISADLEEQLDRVMGNLLPPRAEARGSGS